MDPIYVFGHRNPDSDSVVSAMGYAALRNMSGGTEHRAARLGRVNKETAFLLNKFGFQEPTHLVTVRTQIRDIDFDRPPLLDVSMPVSSAWEILQQQENLSALPVTTADGDLFGMVTAGVIAARDMDSINHPVVTDVPVFNLLSALEGRVINDEEDIFDKVSGEVIIALPTTAPTLENLKRESVVICGNQPEVVELALEKKVACLILCQSDLVEKYRGVSCETCIIATPCDAYRASRMIYQSIPVGRLVGKDEIVSFHLDDFLDDVRETVLKSRYRSYPVLDADDHVVGTLSRYHLIRPRRKRVVLVDHNERAQSVNGLEQADIEAIIDHHRLADVQTGNPVFMRNEPVGSTTTIVATMFQEQGLMPPAPLAGLMAGAILSDTVLFKSPTCTPRDKRIAERLARIAGIDLTALGKEMYSAGIDYTKPAKDLVGADFKEFHIAGHELGIGQITCVETEPMLQRIPDLLEEMARLKKERGYDMVLLMLTDVLKEGTELIFQGDEEAIRSAFDARDIHDSHVFLPGVVSRKKQIVPALALMWG
ncbi:MAG: putative manganese-dependent inorganic diphosphatase [Clostridia bacterium]|nr:putative manganese-dependent inorganic diphosphatase [Clostridia bacterium]